MIKSDLLAAPLAKIARAKHHIDDLHRRIDAYLAKCPYRAIRRIELDDAQIVFEIKTLIPMPDEFPLIVGDAVHNLRSALDLIIFALVGDKCSAPRQVQFPFAAKAENLEATIDRRQIKFAGENVVNIIYKLKPYPCGNDCLYGIHELDVTDKHKLIIPVAQSSSIQSTDLARMLPGMPSKEGVTIQMQEGARFIIPLRINRKERLALRKISPLEAETETQPTFTICFADGQPFHPYPVLSILQSLAKETERAVGLIADAAKGV